MFANKPLSLYRLVPFSEELLLVVKKLDDGYPEWLGYIYQELAMSLSQKRKLVSCCYLSKFPVACIIKVRRRITTLGS